MKNDIHLKVFRGELPLIAATLLPDGFAQTAKNCRLNNGNLVPLRGNLFIETPTKAGTKKTIRLYQDKWLHWLEEVYCIRGSQSGDTIDKIYWTGDGAPKMAEATIALSGGGTNYPTSYYDLGIPAPLTAPDISIAGVAGAGAVEQRIYVCTYVSAYGEEGPPSAPSITLAVEESQTVDVTTPTSPIGGVHNISAKRIYRVNAGETTSEFQLVSEQDVSVLSFNDAVASTSLADVLPTGDFASPPVNLQGLTMMEGGIMAGFVGKDVYFCEPYQHHAWPTNYVIPVKDNIVGLGSYGNSLLVMTDDRPVVITGYLPGEMGAERLEDSYSCVSSRGIVDLGNGVAFPTPNGLMVAGMSSVGNITDKFMSRDNWQALSPESIMGVHHDGKYFGFYDNGVTQGGFIIDPARGDIVYLDFYATAAYSDPLTDNLFFVVTDNIVKYDADNSLLTATWRSPVKVASEPINYGFARVEAKGYPVDFVFSADGVPVRSYSVPSKLPFRLPDGLLTDRAEVEIQTQFEVETISVCAGIDGFKGTK